ncbi:hypothetical protein D1872_234220 [compost metagenome]
MWKSPILLDINLSRSLYLHMSLSDRFFQQRAFRSYTIQMQIVHGSSTGCVKQSLQALISVNPCRSIINDNCVEFDTFSQISRNDHHTLLIFNRVASHQLKLVESAQCVKCGRTFCRGFADDCNRGIAMCLQLKHLVRNSAV